MVLESGVGQRSVDVYKIYNFNSYGGRVPDLVDKEPYTWFDTETKINKEDKSIAFFSSRGACSGRENTYSFQCIAHCIFQHEYTSTHSHYL